jgi:hypothetical protein
MLREEEEGKITLLFGLYNVRKENWLLFYRSVNQKILRAAGLHCIFKALMTFFYVIMNPTLKLPVRVNVSINTHRTS